MLKRLEEAKVTLNKEKCEFVKSSVKFLGHIIDASRVRPDPEKVIAIVAMAEPTNVMEVQCFLGMVNHLSKFLP